MNLNKSLKSILFLSFVTILFLSCQSIKKPKLDVNRPDIVMFPDSAEASRLILSEDVEGFFNEVTPLERQIQLKALNQEVSLSEFKGFLSREVSNWTIEENIQLYKMVQEVKKLCDTINPRLFPAPLRLIKIKTHHYGNDVYYTKGHNIFMPENIFKKFSTEIHFPILVHEVFHIISRYNPELRHDLYKLIGFELTEKPVELNSFLAERKLTNPDAVSYQYTINLNHEGQSYKAIPLISSKFDSYRASHKSFFDYLTFDMYELLEMQDKYLAITNEMGKTTIPPAAMESFFSQIKDNTQYIIHPEEIMADNFMLALMAYSKGDYSKFSPEGKELINKILDRLKKI